jgi:hypothetical protein
VIPLGEKLFLLGAHLFLLGAQLLLLQFLLGEEKSVCSCPSSMRHCSA